MLSVWTKVPFFLDLVVFGVQILFEECTTQVDVEFGVFYDEIIHFEQM